MAVVQSSSDDSPMRHMLPVLWMTTCFHVMGQIGQNWAGSRFVEFVRWRYRGRSCCLRLQTCL